MKTAIQYKKENPWIIEEKFFNTKWLGKAEAIMCLGNGYLGMRSVTEENYIGETRNLFIAGTFNKFDENEVTELPNVPDMVGMELLFDGERLDLSKGKYTNYSRYLNLKTGELTRSFQWAYQDIIIELTFKRCVSIAQKHVFGQQVTIRNLGKDLSIEVISGIDGQITNSGSQHFTEGDKSLVENRFLQMNPQTTQSNISFVLSTVHNLYKQDDCYAETKKRIEMGRRKIYNRYWQQLKPNETLQIEKLSSIHTSIDKEHLDRSTSELKEIALDELKLVQKNGYSKLAKLSADSWYKDVWSVLPIKIKSDNTLDQLAIHFAKYHLHVMTPAHDERMNIGAKGLSGEGYKGHTFWDTEIFMLPYFTFTHPEIAKRLVTYRYLGLAGAHKKAEENGYKGAQFPWEAAWPEDGETTPVWGAADIITGLPTKIWSGFIEQHITSDVTYGIKQFIDVTNDQHFAIEKGYEVIFDTAIFWSSRLEWSNKNHRYELLDVVGPDEYKEHVDNNAFTNYTAHWNIQLAISLYEELKETHVDIYNELTKKMSLERFYKEWKEKVNVIYLPQPNEQGIIPQDDTYLTKETIDLSKYKNSSQVGTLFYEYNLEQVNEMQVSKQADVLLLLFLFENLFPKEEKRLNWDYYEPKTLHDSSLSLSTHAILAADLGKMDLSYELFQRAINIDMGENMLSSNDGIHAASLGGIWQMIVFGYGGIRCLDRQLRIEPNLPKAWQELDFGIMWHQQPIQIIVDQVGFTVINHGNEAIEFIAFDKTYLLKDQTKINF